MRIKITGFKCHVDSDIEFPDGNISLLKGPSGIGKTTILQAIYWCLFGKLRGVYNNAGVTKKCSVTLVFNDIIIYRQKRPELLKVTVGDNVYEDSVGQALINRKFSTRELWKTCCYIEQKQRCGLLAGSNTERMEMLNQLSFSEDDPENCIGRIHEECKAITKDFELKQAQLTANIQIFSKQLQERPIVKDAVLDEDKMAVLQKEINTLVNEVNQLQLDLMEEQRLQGKMTTLEQQIVTAVSGLNNLPLIEESKLMTLKTQIAELESKIVNVEPECLQIINKKKLILELEQANIKVANIERTLNEKFPDWLKYANNNYERRQAWAIQRQEGDRQKGIQECMRLGCEYDVKVLTETKNKLQNRLNTIASIEKKVQSYQQLQSIKKQYAGLKLEDDPDKDKVEKADIKLRETAEKLADLRKGLNLLACPHCAGPLRYHLNKLIPGDREPVTQSEIDNQQKEYTALMMKTNNMRKGQQLYQQIKTYEDLCGDIKEIESYLGDKNKLTASYIQQLIGEISRIVYIDQPEIKSELIILLCDRVDAMTKARSIQNNLNELATVDENQDINSLRAVQDQIKINLRQLRQQEQNLNNNISKRLHIEDNLSRLKEELAKIQLKPEIGEILKAKQEMYNKKKQLYENAIYANGMMVKNKELAVEREKVVALQEDMVALQRLKQNGLNVECKQLQDTVDTINVIMEEYLSIFFSEPITVTLNLFKELKTKKRVKPSVNMKIQYKGSEYDAVNQMSGGEGDRVSLALIMALAKTNNSPILLLDECMTSFDLDLKEMAVRALKSYSDKTILCVDHGGIEGFYDRIVDI